jgi:tRNA G18 (ribose-2'-O)-methylase SpoU
MQSNTVLIAHNLRSAHNVGSLLRTADGLGLTSVYLSGYTPYPRTKNDERLPHIADKVTRQIAKTSLGAETSVNWRHCDDISKLLEQLKDEGYDILALEQTDQAISIENFKPKFKTALIVGREVEGIEAEVLALAARHIELPMSGQKESYNVSVAAAMALFYIKLKNNGLL